jgi:hypothetical protein
MINNDFFDDELILLKFGPGILQAEAIFPIGITLKWRPDVAYVDYLRFVDEEGRDALIIGVTKL